MEGLLTQDRLTTKKRWRILFVAEAVTLAHVARPAVLAVGLDPRSLRRAPGV